MDTLVGASLRSHALVRPDISLSPFVQVGIGNMIPVVGSFKQQGGDEVAITDTIREKMRPSVDSMTEGRLMRHRGQTFDWFSCLASGAG